MVGVLLAASCGSQPAAASDPQQLVWAAEPTAPAALQQAANWSTVPGLTVGLHLAAASSVLVAYNVAVEAAQPPALAQPQPGLVPMFT